jgi:hypothetical protein
VAIALGGFCYGAPFYGTHLFLQVLVKDQVYVCPGGGTPGNLPTGVTSEDVQTAGNLDSALKQVGS